MHIPPVGGSSWGHFSQDPVTNQDIQNCISQITTALGNALIDYPKGTLDFATLKETVDTELATMQNYCQNIPNVNTQQLMSDFGNFQQNIGQFLNDLSKPGTSTFQLNIDTSNLNYDIYYICQDVGLPT